MRCSILSSADRRRLAVILVTLAGGVAWGQAPPEDAGIAPADAGVAASDAPKPPASEAEIQARLSFEAAQRHYDVGRFAEAIALYTRAYDALPLPALLFNIAQCHRQLGNPAEAAFFYRRYLDLADEPANAQVARELLAEMEARAKEQRTAAQARKALSTTSASAEVEAEAPKPPWYRRRWVWAVAGGVIAAGATAAAIHAAQPPAPTLGTVNGR